MTYVTLHISFFVSVLYYSFSLKNEKSFFQSNCVFNIWKFRNKRWAVFWLFRGLFLMTTYNISKTLTKNPTENLTENLSILLSSLSKISPWPKNRPKKLDWKYGSKTIPKTLNEIPNRNQVPFMLIHFKDTTILANIVAS